MLKVWPCTIIIASNGKIHDHALSMKALKCKPLASLLQFSYMHAHGILNDNSPKKLYTEVCPRLYHYPFNTSVDFIHCVCAVDTFI